MPLLLLLLISVLQWLVVMVLPSTPTDFNPTTFLLGNLQIIIIIWVYQTIKKYVKFN